MKRVKVEDRVLDHIREMLAAVAAGQMPIAYEDMMVAGDDGLAELRVFVARGEYGDAIAKAIDAAFPEFRRT